MKTFIFYAQLRTSLVNKYQTRRKEKKKKYICEFKFILHEYKTTLIKVTDKNDEEID